jgi:heptaprenyl diphosphate synthase
MNSIRYQGDNMHNSSRAKTLAFSGIFLALTLVLNLVENMIPPITGLPPGVKLGLSNIVVMYCLFNVNKTTAFSIASLKSVFVLITRGATAGLLSFAGGMLSLCVMLLVNMLSKDKASYLTLSVFGGVSHNFAQIMVASLIVKTPMLLYYFPVLIVSGIAAGTVTSLLLKVTLPQISKLRK